MLHIIILITKYMCDPCFYNDDLFIRSITLRFLQHSSPEQSHRRRGVQITLVQFETQRKQDHPSSNVTIPEEAYYHGREDHGSVIGGIHERKIPNTV